MGIVNKGKIEYTLTEKEIQELVAQDLGVNKSEIKIEFKTSVRYNMYDDPIGNYTKIIVTHTPKN